MNFTALQNWFKRIDALPSRDRMALAGGIVAAAVGVQMMFVTPAQQRRAAMENSSQLEDQTRLDAETQAAQARESQRSALDTRAKQLREQLAKLGIRSMAQDALGPFLARALADSGARIVALRALPADELIIERPAADTAAAAAAPEGAEAAASAPESSSRLYRQHAELRLEGSAYALLQAIETLERGLAPLRIERVRLDGDGDGTQATLLLTTITRERQWLAL